MDPVVSNISTDTCGPPGEQVAAGPLQLRHTCLRRLFAELRATLDDYFAGRASTPGPSPQRETLLANLRQVCQAQVQHDLQYNLGTLQNCAGELGARGEPVISDLLHRLVELWTYLRDTDPSTQSSVEEQCWIALQQFYCDALDLAERLCDLAEGRTSRSQLRRDAQGGFQRHNFLGITGYGRAQTMMQALDVAVPHATQMRVTRTLLPTLAFVAGHLVNRWSALHWVDMERSTRGWLCGQGYAALRERRGPVVRFRGREVFEENAELFDPQTGRARHNIIIAGSHRLGFLDFPFFTEMLRRVPHGVWANNSFYGPGMARKLARDRTAIPVRGAGKLPIHQAIDATIEMFVEQGRALFMIPDGSQPNMMYGHQVRIKRGIRLLVDECVRRTRGMGRRTFVVPMTFDDPLGFTRGLCDQIVVTAHPPLEITAPSSPQLRTSVFNESAVNGGDDLLNHLEALFALHTLQPEYGYWTPDVLAAVRRTRRAVRRCGVRWWLKEQFNTGVSDLSMAVDQ